MNRIKYSLVAIFLLCMTVVLNSCATIGVQPWQRGTLAREDMVFSDNMNAKIDSHIYFSKEASSGGTGSSGGGCGCN